VAQPVTVRLEDGDGLIAQRYIGPVAPKGTSGKKWQFKSKLDGVQKIDIVDKTATLGAFQVKIKAKRWFSAEAADDAPEGTFVIVRVGGPCFSHEATKKIDDPEEE
jgi:hypothetical protein